jgi:hypothetical protein
LKQTKTNKNYKTYKANSNILKLLSTHLNILAMGIFTYYTRGYIKQKDLSI